MNPYLPDLEETKKYYDVLPSGDTEVPSRSISLTHPYKTAEDVLRAIDKHNNNNRDGIYNQMSQSLRNNNDEMLKLIEHDAKVYAYVAKPDRNFNLKALQVNSLIYNLLPESERNSQEISDEYLESMRGDVSRCKISPSEYAMIYKHQFSQSINMAQVFSSENYRRAYETMVREGAYIDGAYREEAMFVAAVRERTRNNQELAKQLDSIERDIWYDNIGINRLKEAAYSDRQNREDDELLRAAAERCPEMQPSIDRKQQEYKEDREQMIKLTVRDELGIPMQQQERMVLENLRMKQEELSVKEKQRMETVIKKAREESAYYLQRDSIENIYAAYVAGDISLTDALSGSGKIEGLQSHGTHGRVVEMTAQAEDLEQHYSQDISDPHYSEGSEMDREADREEEQEYDADRDYEENYAGNPFASYSDPNGMEPTYNPNSSN